MKLQAIERLRMLETKDGALSTEAVLTDAADPESPLHQYFEWNDGVAAEAWRREQARRLIRSVTLTIIEQKVSVRSVAYVRDPETDSGYVSTVTLRTDRDRARKALTAELERAYSAMTRAYDVGASLGISSEIEEIRARIVGMKVAV